MNKNNFNLKNKQRFILFLGLILILILPNCAKYKSTKLNPPQAPTYEKSDLVVSKKILTETEAQNIFGGRKLWDRGYVPIQVYVRNKSNKTYYLNPNDIEIPLESSSHVARKLHRNVGWKSAKYFLIGGPLWAAIEGYSSYEANDAINEDFNEKTVRLDRTLKVRPYGIVNKVMFVSKDNFVDNFKMSLIDPKAKRKVTFDL